MTRICPNCGAKNSASNQFCGTCGTRLGGAAPQEERRWATVLFADVSGFTGLAERMDPEDVGELARRCVAAFSEQVVRYGGWVVREFGDEVLALFGAPVAHEDDAERAVRAALGIRDTVIEGPEGPVHVHVGVNTGEVITTAVRLGDRQDHAVHGDAVNTAARLRTAAPPGTVLVGEETWRAASRAVRYRAVPDIRAKGKELPVRVWEAVEVQDIPQARQLGSAALVGRVEELALLAGVWNKVQHELRPHLVTIIGEAGIGKSRLVAEFERTLTGARVLHGRCPPYGEVVGYWALKGALREAAGVAADEDESVVRDRLGELARSVVDSAGAEDLGDHVAALAGFGGVATSADGPTLFASFRRLIEGLCRVRPVVLVIDDIHWAGQHLLDLLEYVASRVHDAPLLVLTEARPELLDQRPAWGRGVRAFTTISLEPLPAADATALVAILAEKHGLSTAVVERIGAGAGGNPLFAEEMVAMVAERGGGAEVPAAIKALVSARIDALSAAERATLLRAAVFGKTFWAGGLRALGTPEPVGEHLDALESRDFIRAQPVSRFPGDQEYAFKHDLLREVAFDTLLRVDRRRLHGVIVEWIESVVGERRAEYLDLLAHHALQADQASRALHYLLQAADRATQAAAHRGAAALLQQALELAERTEPELAPEILARRGSALRQIAAWPEAEATLAAAVARMPKDDTGRRAEVLVELGMVGMWASGVSQSHAAEALEQAERVGRHDIAVGAMNLLALTEARAGNPLEGLRLYRESLARAHEHGVEIQGAAFESSVLHGVVLYWAGEHDEAIERGRAAVTRARELNDTVSVMHALPQLGLALTARARYAEAQSIFDEALRFGREYELWGPLARALSMSSGFHLEVNDFAWHRAIVEEARDLGRTRLPPVLAFTGVDLLLNHARSGEVGAALALVDEVSAEVAKANAWHRWLSHSRLAVARAEIELARGAHADALHRADEALELCRATHRTKYEALALGARAAALHALGRTKEAVADLRTAVGLARANREPALLVRVSGALLRLDGTDEVAKECRLAADQVTEALPDEMRRHFLDAEEVRALRIRSL